MKRVMWVILLAAMMGCSKDNVLSDEAQLKKDLTAIDKFLDKSGIVAIKDVSGLRIVVADAGSGVHPGGDAKLTLKYKISSLKGTVYKEPQTAVTLTDPLSKLPPGLQYAVTIYIAKGGKATLYMPSALGYARSGSPELGIPGNTNLIWEIELFGYTE